MGIPSGHSQGRLLSGKGNVEFQEAKGDATFDKGGVQWFEAVVLGEKGPPPGRALS